MIRGDLSNRLVHLTRGTSVGEAAENFQSILSSWTLRGSDKDIRGSFRCVCFSEAPLNILTQALAEPKNKNGIRYEPFGVIVSKSWLFKRGGRPVIYQPEEEYELLNDVQKYRHVRYDLNKGSKDFTWEREWRIQTDELKLEPDEVTFVIPTRKWEKFFHDQHMAQAVAVSFAIELPVNQPVPWHFVALEDLGVSGFEEYTL